MWKAAACTYPEGWEQDMRDIKELNEDAFKYLLAIPPRFVLKTVIMCSCRYKVG